ncbi:ABC transporter permease [Guptibacillus hwajinpoensis]|uniref:ABC transporter permease n=1 Tax=Guptibacillus hwajinpoensis TaxID=208199 RepID=UPI00384D1831
MISLFSTEFLKVKRKAVWWLVILGPLGIIGLESVNYGLRYDYLVDFNQDVWRSFLNEIGMFIPLVLLFGITILASITAGIEHQTDAWKQLLVLPVTRKRVFIVKFLFVSVLLLSSSTLLVVGIISLGLILNFGWSLPLLEILKISYLPLLAALPILALQLWISIVQSNQGLALSIGIICAIGSLYSFSLPEWVPFSWPYFFHNTYVLNVMYGCVTGFVVLIVGMTHFSTKDVS